jgi:hypothetical protein
MPYFPQEYRPCCESGESITDGNPDEYAQSIQEYEPSRLREDALRGCLSTFKPGTTMK